MTDTETQETPVSSSENTMRVRGVSPLSTEVDVGIPTLSQLWLNLPKKSQKNLVLASKKYGYTFGTCVEFVRTVRPLRQRAPRKVQDEYVEAVAKRINVVQTPVQAAPVDLSEQFDSFETRLMERISKMTVKPQSIPTPEPIVPTIVPAESKVPTVPTPTPPIVHRRRYRVC